MRWDNLRLTEADANDPALPLFARGAVTRTFDTPEFRGMTFYEVQARSIINRVPAASRVPFDHTINPYRGCGHACRYCLAGDTPVLMADGSTKTIAELRVGDRIYGTRTDGRARRYVRTEVQAHWPTVKPAHRVTLCDGTRLTASGDHRFLSERGWLHVAAGLTPGDVLLGPGRHTEPAGHTVEAAAKVAAVEPLGIDTPMFDITTGTGDFIAAGVVSHNCFARKTHEYLDLDAGLDFDSKVVVKVNAPELTRRELAAPGWRGRHVAMGTNVDCYQRAEGRYRLMRGILAALRDAANPFSVLTKGTLILRDLDLLTEAAQVADVGVNLSVGFTDPEVWRAVEPGTPHPRRRLAACATLNDHGIGCGVLTAPILPYLTDSPAQLQQTVKEIAAAGATHVVPMVLHLRPGAREWYLGWLGREHPRLVPRYLELYGTGAYAPTAYQQRVTDQVRGLAEQHGIGRRTPSAARRIRPPAPPEGPRQLTLL